MIEVIWDKKYEVGHKRIDFEHRIFVDLIRSIAEADERGDSKERISRLLTELKKYAEFHFCSEENVMIDVAFPDLEMHKQEHVRLLAQLSDKVHGFTNDDNKLDDVVEFIFSWFALHTTQKDKEIARYIDQKGVK
ncbi:MAG: hemerythrin [Gammaproteobacteria bacterium]|nr:MAG: hemerythrin [Gammaproteobacteria bacterium]